MRVVGVASLHFRHANTSTSQGIGMHFNKCFCPPRANASPMHINVGICKQELSFCSNVYPQLEPRYCR